MQLSKPFMRPLKRYFKKLFLSIQNNTRPLWLYIQFDVLSKVFEELYSTVLVWRISLLLWNNKLSCKHALWITHTFWIVIYECINTKWFAVILQSVHLFLSRGTNIPTRTKIVPALKFLCLWHYLFILIKMHYCIVACSGCSSGAGAKQWRRHKQLWRHWGGSRGGGDIPHS